MDKYDMLRGVYFFKGLGDDAIRRIGDACHEESFEPGKIIFAEGAKADKLYIILDGTVEVWKDFESEERDLLAVHSAGHLFGEMALIDDLPRSATVAAREAARLLSVGRADFHRIIAEDSGVALSVMRSVSSMVRMSNESFVNNLRRRNSELVKTNRELKKTQDKLLKAERLSLLGKFSSLILHDIRNPIAILRGFAEMIAMRSDEQEIVKRYVMKIMAEADRLNRIAGELLDYSRGEIALTMSIVNMQDLVSKAVEIIRERFASKGIEIRTDVKYPGPVILDNERILRVLLNLADNSRKAMANGGVFSIAVSREEKKLLLEVTDTGVGMDKEVQKRLFEPYYTRGSEGGTGLGMTIVKNIVDAHEGSLTFTSRKNEGTVFKITLPIVA
jgi:signal transduction histidine kinase